MHRFVLLFLAFGLFACKQENHQEQEKMSENKTQTDWQGHRGARGLLPENTVPAFLLALGYPLQTLEMDLAVSADGQLVVSHEPWMSAEICSTPEGQLITEDNQQDYAIYKMTFAEVQQFDCGSRPHDRFPDQKKMKAVKPSLAEVIDTAEAYAARQQRPAPFYNIEIKSKPEWDTVFTPEVDEFARLLLDMLQQKGIADRACVQSFDVRALQAVREQSPLQTTALLVENADGVDANLEKLGFIPEIYSPYYRLLTANVVQHLHEKGMKVIPWTVNETEEMQALLEIGVDGIITDYPDRIPFN